jgi:hypothetical protein
MKMIRAGILQFLPLPSGVSIIQFSVLEFNPQYGLQELLPIKE